MILLKGMDFACALNLPLLQMQYQSNARWCINVCFIVGPLASYDA